MALKQDGRIFRAIAWRSAEQHDYLTEHAAALDVAFSLEQNQHVMVRPTRSSLWPT